MSSSGKYNVVSIVAEFLDIHLMLPILNFMQDKQLYPKEEIIKSKIELLSNTNMVAYLGDCYKELKVPLPGDIEQKKKNLLDTHKSIEAKLSKFTNAWKKITDNEESLKHLSSGQLTAEYLEKNYNVHQEDIDSIYTNAKFTYECGNYASAISQLQQFRMFNTNPSKNLSALWGILASEILMSRWTEAEADIALIRDLIEDKFTNDPTKQLQNRLWLMHWSLFVYFHLPTGPASLLDFVLGNEKYLRAIEFKAPHILRYLIVAAVLSKHKLSDLVKFIKQDSINYSDPVTDFIRLLCIKYDFDGAEGALKNCQEVLENDFFIQQSGDETRDLTKDFLTNARYAICEAFCKIHSTIDIAMMAKKLGLSMEESEWWIVNLIRNSKLDAKIDSANNRVIVSSQVPSVYHQLLEKTKTLSLRSSLLASNIERGKVQAQREEKLINEGQYKDLY
jgi:translation initiation factor 3 subunit E